MENQSCLRKFARYSSLNIIGMIGLSCYILADTFFVAQGVGADGLTALNLAIPVFSLINGTGLMIGVGGATRFSISRSKKIFTQSLIFGIFCAVVIFLSGLFFSGQISTLLGANSEIHSITNTYLKILMLFAPMFITNDILSSFVRNDNDPKLAMIAMLTGTFMNILFDYILVFPLNMGIAGAALATGFSPLVSICILSAHFFGKKNTLKLSKVLPTLKAVKDICKLGIAALITELSSGIVMLIFNNLILSLEGNLGVAAYGIIANIAMVVISIFTGIAQGSQPIISQSYGKGQNGDARKILKYGLITATVFALIVYVVTFIFTEPIVNLFDNEGNQSLTGIAVSGFRIYFTSIFFSGINILCASYFSAIDKPKYGFIISILRGFVVIIPFAFLFSLLFQISGIWASLTATELVVCVIAAVFLKKRNITN